MELFLVQHGDAVPEEENPERPLSEKGRRDAEGAARKLARLGVLPGAILHSPKLRAKQTAEIFASALGVGITEVQGLKPNDDATIARDLIEIENRGLMLVGHLPHLNRLASLLLANNPDADIVSFRMGGVVCLEKEGKKWRLKWAMTPETNR